MLAASLALSGPIRDAYAAGSIVSLVFYVFILVAVIAVVYTLITDDRDPSTILAWLFVIVLLPILGVILYFFIGRNYRRDNARRAARRAMLRELTQTSLQPTLTANAGFTQAVVRELANSPGGRIATAGQRESHVPPLPADAVEVYVAGAQKFPNLLKDLARAERYIHLMYLIWEQDELTAQVTDVLLDRLKAGVQVHIIYDWLSCITYKKDELKRLAAAGAVVRPCYKQASHINYRNHMKMAIVDGDVVYTGGMNMGQEYIDGGKRFAIWRDTHVRMTGPIVAPYIALFATTWILNGGDEDLVTGYINEPVTHAPGEGTPVQMLHSSVETKQKAIRDAFIVALTNARERVWVQSPYFVPDEPLITAMCVAAASGIDVRFMMTGVPDKKVPFFAAHAYYRQLVEAGVRVYQYKAGFLHAKTVTVDEQLCMIGTCNWDIRSIILHEEVVAAIYDTQVAKTHAAQYETDIANCLEITIERLQEFSAWEKFRNQIYRLFSRLL